MGPWPKLVQLRSKGGCLHHPWLGQDQDKEETSNESRQEDDVRPGSRCQSKACQDCRQGIPNSCAQERYLILHFVRQAPGLIHRVGRPTVMFVVSGMLAW